MIYNVWPNEIEKWEDFAGLSHTIVHGAEKAHNVALLRDIYLINPEGVPWLFASEVGKRLLEEIDLLVIDESSKFRNSQSKRFKSLKPLLPLFKRRWILTGTPVPNGLEGLFGQIYILDLGRSLGRFITHFRREFFHLGGYSLYDWQPNPDAWEKVTERISPLVLQMSAEEYLEMPELVNLSVPVTLPSSVRILYDNLDEEFIGNWEGVDFVGGTKAIVGVKLRQIANGALYDEDHTWTELHQEKLGALESLLEELGGSPALVLFEFNHDRERILARFRDLPTLGSGIKPETEADYIRRFNLGEIPILLGHPASMGHGLNLQGACHHIVWFGIPWDLEYYDQAVARVYRQGQTSSRVFVHHIVAKDTKDEEVIKTLDSKDRTQQGLLKRLSRHRRENYGEN